jgi:hypothetical protein
MKKIKVIGPVLFLCLFVATPDAEAATKTSSTTPAISQAESEKRVREYFKDTPVMIEIARCESNFRQFTDAGSVLRGGDSGGMVGVFQFFESIHATPAKALGFDIATLEGNLGYAKHLYKEQNTVPWEPARSCWDVKPTTVKTPATRAELEAKIKQLMELIKLLQQLQELKAKRVH